MRRASDAWTQPLWPLHLKPLPDELLSSWLARLAQAHGLKVQTFCRLLFGSAHRVWNRDIDRLAPDWILDPVCRSTATSRDVAWEATLRSYEGKIYRDYRESSVIQWILPLLMYHQVRRGFGLQFCAQCLRDDDKPYFRKRWRVAFYTYCTQHNTMLQDRCPACGAPVAFHRRELGHPKQIDGGSITQCHACDFDLRQSDGLTPAFYDASARQAFELAARRLEHSGPAAKPRSVQYYNVLHQLCWLMGSRYRSADLLEFARKQVGAPTVSVTTSRLIFERRWVEERHHIVQLAFWYMADLEPRLTAAWRDGAITYSALLRDFEDRPGWYDRVVGKFSDWRTRPKHHVLPRIANGRFRDL